MKRLALLIVVLVPSLARAQDLKDRFNIRLSLSGMYAAEQQSALPAGTDRAAQVASPYELAWGELRAVVDARRLPGSFDLHVDGRVRLTGTWNRNSADSGADGFANRGYLGGNEYEVRQAWVRRRGEKVDFGLGRMIVPEADALKIDGLRLWWRMAKHWDASLYAGGYPDPFSRSLTSDYNAGPPGSGGSGAFGFAGGVDATYTYDKIWGSFAVSSSYLSGNDDGGALPSTITDPASMNPVTGKPATETPRTWITWTDYVRLVSWLDVFTDLVLDVTGSAGVQLTRLDVLATARAGKHLTLHVGYDHLSAFAIEMWLTRLLASRLDHVAGTIENNLIVERTSRDEVRGDAELSFGKFSVYADGRFRRRALVSLSSDPQFVANGQQIAPGTAWDVTLGVRDRGSLWGLREGVWGMLINDYRARDFILGVTLGRSFFEEKLTIDLSFLYASVTDALAGAPIMQQCTSPLPVAQQQTTAPCYGRRGGADYELGITVTTAPFNHWFAFIDYRLMADTSGGNLVEGAMALPQPTVITHVLLLRIEARY